MSWSFSVYQGKDTYSPPYLGLRLGQNLLKALTINIQVLILVDTITTRTASPGAIKASLRSQL